MSLEFISLERIHDIAHQYGYWAIFLGILLENLGFPLPGETLTLVGGFLAGSNELSYWLVLSDATAGAFLGGTCGYWIGRIGGWSLLMRLLGVLKISEARIINAKKQFSENAFKAIFFGRFFALLRVFAAPLAGIAEIPFTRFMVYNFAGAATWAGIMVSLAFFAGRVISLEQLITWVSHFAILALFILLVLIFAPLWFKSHQTDQSGSED